MKDIKKIIIKVGTSTLALENGKLNLKRIKKLVRVISTLIEEGYEIMLVSSGAIGAGIGKLDLKKRPEDIPTKRILAAVGQVELMHIYENIFFAYDKIIAQLLLTKDDFFGLRFINLKNLCENLIDRKIIPIINENDAVVINELKVGDNDTLSAMCLKIIDADLLIILTDIDGLYDKNPKEHKDAKLIKEVYDIKEVENFSFKNSSKLGTGGMKTKLEAYKIVNEMKKDMVIINGENPFNIIKVLNGEKIGTRFRGVK